MGGFTVVALVLANAPADLGPNTLYVTGRLLLSGAISALFVTGACIAVIDRSMVVASAPPPRLRERDRSDSLLVDLGIDAIDGPPSVTETELAASWPPDSQSRSAPASPHFPSSPVLPCADPGPRSAPDRI